MKSKLEARVCPDPAEFEKTLQMREKMQHLIDFSPAGSIEHLWNGTYFLERVDEKYRRTYYRKTADSIVDIHGNKLDVIANGEV